MWDALKAIYLNIPLAVSKQLRGRERERDTEWLQMKRYTAGDQGVGNKVAPMDYAGYLQGVNWLQKCFNGCQE